MDASFNPAEGREKAIKNVENYVRNNLMAIEEQYLTVRTKSGIVKNSNIYKYIDGETYHRELLGVSVVILTANEFESDILNYNVYKDCNREIMALKDGITIFGDKDIISAYIMELDGYKILHLHTKETGSNTPCGSTDLVRYIESCEYLSPSCVISFGICYGTNCEDYSLGDTLVARRVYPWSIGIKINEDGWKIRCDEFVINAWESNPIMYNKIEDLFRTCDKFGSQRAFVANMLSAEAVVNSEKVKIEAIEKVSGNNIAGGEMEGYGLVKECVYYARIPCLILKAICDWGAGKDIEKYIKVPGITGKLKDYIQAYTAYCAYRVLRELFKECILPKANFADELVNSLTNNFYGDGSVLKRVMDEHINNFIATNYKKNTNLTNIQQQRVKDTIYKMLLEDIAYLSDDEECYIFIQHLYDL